VSAWEKAGARAGWLPPSPFRYAEFREGAEGLSRANDAGMRGLAELTSLESLDLDSTAVTDAGLKELSALKNLKRIGLCATKISTCEAAKEWTSLRTLDLRNTSIGDLKNIVGLQHLEALHLGSTGVADASLVKLASMKNLRFLDLGRTSVTNDGVENLRQANPALRISR
jgi:hypothetical protein